MDEKKSVMDAEKFNRLIRALDSGDESAYEEIHQAYGRMILWIGRKITRDWHHAQDVLDVVMQMLWNKSEKIKNIQKPDSFIYRVSKRAAISYCRKYIKKTKHDISIDVIPQGKTVIDINQQGHLGFFLLIDCLKQDEQDIVIKRTYFNEPYAEIAEELKLPEGTVRSKYSRILKKLRKIMKDEENSS